MSSNSFKYLISDGYFKYRSVYSIWEEIQSNFNGSNIFGTMEICSRYGYFEPLRVNHGTRSGSK